MPYRELFGGASAINKEFFEKINGFSNLYWGWGGEGITIFFSFFFHFVFLICFFLDDDMFERINIHGRKISRYPSEFARYFMLLHKKDDPNLTRYLRN